MAHTKHANSVANEHRKKAASLPFRLAGYVTGSTNANWTKSMTPVELHAELVYAESLFEKVCLLGHKHVTRADFDRVAFRPCWGLFIPATGSHSSKKRAHNSFSPRLFPLFFIFIER